MIYNFSCTCQTKTVTFFFLTKQHFVSYLSLQAKTADTSIQAVTPDPPLIHLTPPLNQAQPISPELTAKLLGNRVAVSPIVTVEPRRRKFHKAITLTIPVPTAAGKGMINDYGGGGASPPNSLRLLCSITGMGCVSVRRGEYVSRFHVQHLPCSISYQEILAFYSLFICDIHHFCNALRI